MASDTYNIGKRGVLDGTVDHDDGTLKVALFTGTFTFNVDHADVAAVVAVNTEATGYVRPTLQNVVVAQEGGGNRVFISADDTSVATTGSQTITAMLIYEDGNSVPLVYYDGLSQAYTGDGMVLKWGDG